MNRYMKIALGAILPVALLGGCSDWLTGNKLTSNPNFPTSASRDQLLTGVMVGQTIVQTGDLARLFSMWMQQMAGVDRQYIPLGTYSYDEDAFSPDWNQLYTAGGLIDERSMQQNALQAGDSLYAGIGMVWEALTVGTTADIWGDIPYSQAVSNNLKPKLDPQQDVYAAIQAKLDTAITYMHCKAATCVGPGTVDLIYGGNSFQDTAWIELAHTLKARYYLHVAPRLGAAAYDSALVHADSGLSTPAHDFNSYQSGNSNEWNLWYQFIQVQRSGYIAAGAFLVNLLSSTKDPRLTLYFAPATAGGTITGANPGQKGTFANLSATRLAPSFRQPMVTFAENQLIRAEAALQTGATATALAAYNAERTAQGVPTKGSIALSDIITEKYIALFQQIEPWNDYKRTCLPALTPAPGTSGIPRRLLYPLSAERNTNPNVPPPSAQPAANWNDPTGHC